jgi:hypothetical protein
MEGSALACAGLGDEGGEPMEWSSRITIMARGEGGGAPRPRRAAPAAGTRPPRTDHGWRRNRREWKGGAPGITDHGSILAEVAGGGRSSGGGGARYGAGCCGCTGRGAAAVFLFT